MMGKKWSFEEEKKLTAIWPERKRLPIGELRAMFNGRSYRSISTHAWEMGLSRTRLSDGEGNRLVLSLLLKRKMTTAQLKQATGYSPDVIRGILASLRDAGSIRIATKLNPPRGGWPHNVWEAVSAPDASQTVIEQLRPHAGNPFAQLLL